MVTGAGTTDARNYALRTGSMGSTPEFLMSRNAATTVFFRPTKVTPLVDSQVDANQNCHASFNRTAKHCALERFQVLAGNQRAHTFKYKALRRFQPSLFKSASRAT